jgi:hypothetical protein
MLYTAFQKAINSALSSNDPGFAEANTCLCLDEKVNVLEMFFIFL